MILQVQAGKIEKSKEKHLPHEGIHVWFHINGVSHMATLHTAKICQKLDLKRTSLGWYCWWFRHPANHPGSINPHVNNGDNLPYQLVNARCLKHQQYITYTNGSKISVIWLLSNLFVSCWKRTSKFARAVPPETSSWKPHQLFSKTSEIFHVSLWAVNNWELPYSNNLSQSTKNTDFVSSWVGMVPSWILDPKTEASTKSPVAPFRFNKSQIWHRLRLVAEVRIQKSDKRRIWGVFCSCETWDIPRGFVRIAQNGGSCYDQSQTFLSLVVTQRQPPFWLPFKIVPLTQSSKSTLSCVACAINIALDGHNRHTSCIQINVANVAFSQCNWTL